MVKQTGTLTVYLDGDNLSIGDVINVAENLYEVDYPPKAWDRISEFRKGLEDYMYEYPEEPIYGVTRGCGDLLTSVLKGKERRKYLKAYAEHKNDLSNAEKRIKREGAFKEYLTALEDYQKRYMLAHNCGTGAPLPIEVVRAIMVIRLNSFAKALSAVRRETCKLIIDMLNRRVTPWVLEEGSVGASGDLVPLAMIGAVLLGLPEAKAYYDGKLVSARVALKRAELEPVKLGAKEAMALTNGSNLITALCVFAARDVDRVLKNASISSALTLEAIRGEKNAFSVFISEARKHRGHKEIAKQVRGLLKGSERTTEKAQRVAFPRQISEDESGMFKGGEGVSINGEDRNEAFYRLLDNANTAAKRIQDRYSFRSVPQVHGTVFDALIEFKRVVTIEINSATDNPLIKENINGKFEAFSGANFHGQPMAVVIDYLKTALTGLSLITNKRTFSVLDKAQNFGLPADLAIDPSGGDTGLMIAQYAGAARAAESRILSTPASVTSISTAANQEDFVSMGTVGALHLRKVIYNTQIVIATEILCALRGLQMTLDDLPPGLRGLGKGTKIVFNYLDRLSGLPKKDGYVRTDIELVLSKVKSGELVSIVTDII